MSDRVAPDSKLGDLAREFAGEIAELGIGGDAVAHNVTSEAGQDDDMSNI